MEYNWQFGIVSSFSPSSERSAKMGHDPANGIVILVVAWAIGHFFLRNLIRGMLATIEVVLGLIIIVIIIVYLTHQGQGGKTFDGHISPGIIYQGQSP